MRGAERMDPILGYIFSISTYVSKNKAHPILQRSSPFSATELPISTKHYHSMIEPMCKSIIIRIPSTSENDVR
jgi:hypothetical protein